MRAFTKVAKAHGCLRPSSIFRAACSFAQDIHPTQIFQIHLAAVMHGSNPLMISSQYNTITDLRLRLHLATLLLRRATGFAITTPQNVMRMSKEVLEIVEHKLSRFGLPLHRLKCKLLVRSQASSTLASMLFSICKFKLVGIDPISSISARLCPHLADGDR